MGGGNILRSGCVSRLDAWSVSIRMLQYPRVYALEGEFIYLQGQRNFVNWGLECPHTLSLIPICDTIGLDEITWSDWDAATVIDNDNPCWFTRRSTDVKTRVLVLARSFDAE